MISHTHSTLIVLLHGDDASTASPMTNPLSTLLSRKSITAILQYIYVQTTYLQGKNNNGIKRIRTPTENPLVVQLIVE